MPGGGFGGHLGMGRDRTGQEHRDCDCDRTQPGPEGSGTARRRLPCTDDGDSFRGVTIWLRSPAVRRAPARPYAERLEMTILAAGSGARIDLGQAVCRDRKETAVPKAMMHLADS